MEPWGRGNGDGKALALPPSRPNPSFAPPNDGYFTAQAWRAGLLDDGGFRRVGFMPPMFPMGSIQREIEKERIREEIIREMEERRILEEEVRRELEAEGMMAMRTPMDGFYDRMNEKNNSSEFMIREGYQPNQWRPISEAPSNGVWPQSNLPTMKVDKKSPITTSQKLETGSANASQCAEVQLANEKLGTKRKAEAQTETSKLAKTVNKDWSCALCQVNATSEQSLNNHFDGKKHKAKVEALKGTSKIVNNTWGTIANLKPNPAAANTKEGKPNNAPKIINIQVNGKMYQVLQRKNYLWCATCKLKCNSTIAMVSHLGGKKHNALMMESEKDKKLAEISTPGYGQKVVEESVPQVSLEEEGKLDEGSQGLPEPDDTEVPIEKDHNEVPTGKASEKMHTKVPTIKDHKACD